jgi:serine/threonine-protein kinase
MRIRVSSTQNTFGPYFLGATIGARNGTELSLATLFGGTGDAQTVVLRQTREYHDGSSDVFMSAAQRYAILHHHNVVPVLDLGTIDGRSYVATQYIRGKNLLRVLARCGQKRIGFPTDVALYIVMRALDALEYAHAVESREGRITVLHGDLSHSNILVTGRGEVLVSDFEMSCASTRRRTRRGVNRGGGKGYSSYISPEQARGETTDPRSDVFSLGVVLFELVTGHLMFNAATEASILEQLGTETFEVPLDRHRPDLHPGLAAIVKRALAAKADDRFSCAAEFKDAIRELLAKVGANLQPLFLANFMEMLFGKDLAEIEDHSS